MAATIVSRRALRRAARSKTPPTSDRRRGRTRRAWRSRAPASAPSAPSGAAWFTSRSTDARMSARSSSVASPSDFRNCRIRTSGSRRASASRSAGVLYSFSSSESECEYGTDDGGVDEHRPLALAHVRDRLAHRAVAGEVVGAVAAEHAQVREVLDDARDVAARRLHFDRDRDRVAVVLDEVQDRQLPGARRVERLPELAFAGRAVADRDVGDLVGLELRLAIGNARRRAGR